MTELTYKKIKDWSGQIRFNPDKINSKVPVSYCAYCGAPFTKKTSDICAMCRIISEELSDDKKIKTKQIKL